MQDPQKIIEARDAVAHLERQGFGPLLEALRDPECYPTRGATAGGISVRAIARRLDLSSYAADKLLCRARAALLA